MGKLRRGMLEVTMNSAYTYTTEHTTTPQSTLHPTLSDTTADTYLRPSAAAQRTTENSLPNSKSRGTN